MNYVDIKIEHVELGETNDNKENGEIVQMETSILGTDSDAGDSEDFDADPDFSVEPKLDEAPIFFK